MQETTKENFPEIQSNRYRVLEILGAGAVGTVYKAEDTNLGIMVAIKILKKSAVEAEAIRFQREAKLAGALQHPNILSVFDFGLTDKREPYLVLSFVEGQTLADRMLQPDEIELSEALDIFIQLARGLAHAQMKNVVHRDLKPQNIMLLSNPRTAEERVKIVDFGMAKSEFDQQGLTKFGVGLGTPLYMSPEQAEGKDVDARADQYALGSIMYEILVGEPPFIAESIFELIEQKLKGDIPSVTEYAKYEIPSQLEVIINRCLRTNPEERYSNTADVLSELEQIRNELVKGTVADGASTAQVASKRFDRSFALIVGVILLVIAVVAAYSLIPGEEKSRKLNIFQPYQDRDHVYECMNPTNEDLKFFLAHLPSSKIDELIFTDSKITPKGYLQLRSHSFPIITLKRGSVTEETLKNLAKVESMGTLKMFTNDSVDNEGLKSLVKSKSLVEVDLNDQANISDLHMDALSNLTALKRIEVKRSRGKVTGGFKNWNRLVNLETVLFDYSDVRDSDIANLVNLPLKKLTLNATGVTGKAVGFIKRMRKLEDVDFAMTPAVNSLELNQLILDRPDLNIRSKF